MPKSPSSKGQGFPCPRKPKTNKPSPSFTRRQGRPPSLIYQLCALGIGLTASAAVLSWATRFGIDTDWSMTQLAQHAKKCDRKTISNAMPVLLAQGLVEPVSDYVFIRYKNQGNRRGTYRFTPKLYAMLGKARKGSRQRENIPMPLAFVVPMSMDPTNVQHQHKEQAPGLNAMPDGNSPRKDLQHVVETAVEPSVVGCVESKVNTDEITKTLIEIGGLDKSGAIAAAKALPPAYSGEFLAFMIKAAQEVISLRPSVRAPKAFLHSLLTSGDQAVLRHARKLQEEAKAAVKSARVLGVDQVLSQAHPSFRALPGASETVQAYLMAQKELEALPAVHNSRQFYCDQLGLAKNALVDLAAPVVGAGGPPQSVVERLVWKQRILELALGVSPQAGAKCH